VSVVEHPRTQELGEEWFVPKSSTEESVGLSNLSKAYEGDTFYAVQLDNRIVKSLYKDDLLLPSRALAVAVAEEWES
jgi:chaperone required for assembly of F1-ATPase